MSKMHLKRSFNNINITIVIILFLVFSICKFLVYINNKTKKIVIDIGISNSSKLVSIIVNNAVKDAVSSNNITNDLFITYNDSSNNIYTIDLNSSIVNNFLNDISLKVEKNLLLLENGKLDDVDYKDLVLSYYDEKNLINGVVYKVPLGVIFNNSFLANFGPNIPIKFTIAGYISSDLDTKISNYGINNALVESFVHISVSLNILIPFYSKTTSLTYDVPLTVKIINGQVPNYYSNGSLEGSSSINVPIS